MRKEISHKTVACNTIGLFEQRNQIKSAAYGEKKMFCFSKTRQLFTHPLKRWQNCTNWSTNVPPPPVFSREYLRATVINFLTWRDGVSRRNLRQMMMPNSELMHIFEPFRNCTIWNMSKFYSTVRISISTLKESMWKNKINFGQIVVFIIAIFGTFHFM